MRKQFVKTVTELLRSDKRYVLLLGDIGVHGFKNAAAEFPDRVINVGILEQATVGMAAGLAIAGFIPIVHTIAPFLVERAYEQLKVDFGYQNLTGIFVSVGASYDYASLGCTHHCPGDVNVLENIPNFKICVPGNQSELDTLLKSHGQGPVYIRMTEHSYKLLAGLLVTSPEAKQVAVIGIGPCMDMVLKASEGLPVCHVYSSVLNPFPLERIYGLVKAGIKKFVVVEPYFSSQLANYIRNFAAASDSDSEVINFSLPRVFFTGYGNKDEQDKEAGFTEDNLRGEIVNLIK